MKSDTTLRVFDDEGMYTQLSNIVTDTQQHPERSSVRVEENGPGCLSVSFMPRCDDNDALLGLPPAAEGSVQIGEIADFPPTLSDIEKMLDAHPAGLSKAFAQWLVRICRASDARIVQLEDEVKLKQSDFNGLVSEWQDLADENRKLTQQAEVDRVVCDSQERTILELQAKVKELEDSIDVFKRTEQYLSADERT